MSPLAFDMTAAPAHGVLAMMGVRGSHVAAKITSSEGTAAIIAA